MSGASLHAQAGQGLRSGAKLLSLPWARKPRVHRARLENGLDVIVAPLPHLHTVTLSAHVKVGSRFETPETNGLSHFLEHMLFRGTQSHPSPFALNLAIEQLGGTLEGATHADSTLYEVTLPPECLARGMEVLGEMFRAPVFHGVEVEKRVVREEILESLDEDGCNVDLDDISRHQLFGSHALGLSITGRADNLEHFGVTELRTHMQRFYGARNMVVCLAGAVRPRYALALAQRCFGELPEGERAVPRPAEPVTGGPRFHHVETHGSQTEIRLSFPTFGESDPRQMALQLLVRILDDGMSTRLHRRICDEEGLAYDVFATLDPYEDCGVLDVGATVEHAKTPAVLRALLQLLTELREHPVADEELAKAKRRYRWDLRATLDDAEGLCAHYGSQALYGLSGDLGELGRQAERLDTGALQQVARDVIRPDGLHVACVGAADAELERKARGIVHRFC